MQKVRIGILGCGAISGQYLDMAKNFPILEIAACCDLDAARAKWAAEKYAIEKICTLEELLADKSIDIILNLTVPKAHGPTCLQILQAGKHVYVEKPLSVTREEASKLIETAKSKNLRIGCAPDTFMGAGAQTARKLIDDGAIGRPVSCTAFMMSFGVETWHPNPEFYYQPGGGPMLDMGPYYLTALLNLLGPMKRISGMASIAVPERTITHRDRATGKEGPKFGKKIHVEVPDHITGLMEFQNGCIGTIITSFATRFGNYDGKQSITIYGTEGAMRVPDPNHFDGAVSIRRTDDADWSDPPLTFVKGYGRAVGLADMAYAIRSGRANRASGEQGFAVLDLMQGFLDSSTKGAAYQPQTQYKRPAPMPADLPFGILDE
jgi:predicted dehydrogenase